MAAEVPGLTITLEAAADLSAAQYKFVKVTAANTVNVTTATTDKAVGVLQNKPAAAARAATVMVNGVTKMVAGAAVTAGALVMSNASAQAVTATATNQALGIALSSVSNAGEIVTVLLKDFGTQ
jgi:Uncharacterized conserved protein (DUF2190)